MANNNVYENPSKKQYTGTLIDVRCRFFYTATRDRASSEIYNDNGFKFVIYEEKYKKNTESFRTD
jgi:hypothetical protein